MANSSSLRSAVRTLFGLETLEDSPRSGFARPEALFYIVNAITAF